MAKEGFRCVDTPRGGAAFPPRPEDRGLHATTLISSFYENRSCTNAAGRLMAAAANPIVVGEMKEVL
jgi:hypothetical protein